MATVIAEGGNGGYTYLWDNGETTPTAESLEAGSHYVIITDGKGNTCSCSVVIDPMSESGSNANGDAITNIGGQELGTGPIIDVNIAPNPFIHQTEIRISTPVDAHIRIELYHLDGSKLQTTFDDMIYANEMNIINCEVENVGSARQLMCVIHTPYGIITKKMVVINQ